MPIGKPLQWTLGIASVVVMMGVVWNVARSLPAHDPTVKPKEVEKDRPTSVLVSPEQAAKLLEEYRARVKPTELNPFQMAISTEVQKSATPGDSHPTGLSGGGRVFTPEMEAALPEIASIKPLPEVAIPDNPPPHEGALFDLPYTVHPPDLVLVEILEALPGRPITGERLVRPDGTITMGFYGDIHVRGLTREQLKLKVVLHMRKFLTDDTLGLLGEDVESPSNEQAATAVPPPAPTPAPPPPPAPAPAPPPAPIPTPPDDASPFDVSPKPGSDKPAPNVKASPKPAASRSGRGPRTVRLVQSPGAKAALTPPTPNPPAKDEPEKAAAPSKGQPKDTPARLRTPDGLIFIHPTESDRVYVDVASYNSQVYLVLGDVGSPGRLPWTGQETVLDAMQYAGGFVDSADPKTMRLVRPARAGKPARNYPIDWDAIQNRGEAKANLQLFPGDRLLVGRKASTEALVKLNEQLAPSLSMLSHMLTYSFAMRSFNNIGEAYHPNSPMVVRAKVGGYNVNMDLGPDAPPADPAKRKEALKAWSELISKDPAVREEILKLIK